MPDDHVETAAAASPPALDPATRALIALAAAIAQGDEGELRDRVAGAVAAGVPAAWGDELLLQSVLMVGWPRALVAASFWRSAVGAPGDGAMADLDYAAHAEWTRRGTETCHTVYGGNYAKLRQNVRALHPALDAWMLTEGYGRTMSRPGLDLARRELCVIAQTAVLQAPRQLHSHLRGALHAGASLAAVDAALAEVRHFVSPDAWPAVEELWRQVRDSRGAQP